MPTPARRTRTAAVSSLLVTVSASLLAVLVPQPAEAAQARFSGYSIVNEAARHRGAPYAYGATGPRAFDCSGFTAYVYGRMGKSLPHSSYAQYAAVRHIPRSQVRPGDLIFTDGLGHVGIYAGNNTFWVAPHSGSAVKLQTIYTRNYLVGRA